MGETRAERARREVHTARDARWSVQGVAGFTTRSRVDDTREQGGMPPRWVLDRIADREFWGGYEDRATCPTCQTRRAANGTCFC